MKLDLEAIEKQRQDALPDLANWNIITSTIPALIARVRELEAEIWCVVGADNQEDARIMADTFRAMPNNPDVQTALKLLETILEPKP